MIWGLTCQRLLIFFLSQMIDRETLPFEINESTTANGKLPRSELRGCLKGKVWMADDFDAPLDVMREYME